MSVWEYRCIATVHPIMPSPHAVCCIFIYSLLFWSEERGSASVYDRAHAAKSRLDRSLVKGREQLVSLSREDLGVEFPLVSLELARRPDGHEVAADGQVDDRWTSDLIHLRWWIMLTSGVAARKGDKSEHAKDLVPVIGADGDAKAPAGGVLARLAGRLSQAREVDVGVQVECFGDLGG